MQDTNTQHLHDETKILPLQELLKLHASEIKGKTQPPSNPLHKLTIHTPSPNKQTTFNNTKYPTNISTNTYNITKQDINTNLTTINTTIITKQLTKLPNNTILHTTTTIYKQHRRNTPYTLITPWPNAEQIN